MQSKNSRKPHAVSRRKRCGAMTRSGNPCKGWAVAGSNRCRMHGGAPGTGRPPTHGLHSKRFKKLTAEGNDRIAQLRKEPDLLDARHPVAVAAFMVEEADWNMEDLESVKVLVRLVDHWGKKQESAVRQSKTAEVLTAAVLPAVQGLVLRMVELARKHFGADEAALAKYREDLVDAVKAMVAEVDRAGALPSTEG